LAAKTPKDGGRLHGTWNQQGEEAHDEETSLRGHDGKLIGREEERNCGGLL